MTHFGTAGRARARRSMLLQLVLPVAVGAVAAACDTAQGEGFQPPPRDDLFVGEDEEPDVQLDQPARNVFRPAARPPSAQRISELRLPAGFEVRLFAEGLGHPRMLAVADDGAVFVTRPDQGDVLRLADLDADGVSDTVSVALSGIPGAHGIALRGDELFLAALHTVHAARLAADGTVLDARVVIDDLPDAGQHPNRTLAFGPDGGLYIGVGSMCNACVQREPESGTVLRADPQRGYAREIWARGLRNTVGFAFHPQTGELWGSDNGADWRGNAAPPDELNRIVRGADYGWPFCHGKRSSDSVIEAPAATSQQAYCAGTEPSLLEYPAHSVPIAMLFYDAVQFPSDYRHDAFVALRGSWNAYPPAGYKVARIRFRDGVPLEIEDFVSGFLIEDGAAQFARLAGLAVARDGSLLVTDDQNGVVYRIAHVGAGRVTGDRSGSTSTGL